MRLRAQSITHTGVPQPHISDPHNRASSLSDIILGGQDGLVNVLGVILGMAAATNDPHLVVVAGLAATFAESVSMGAVAYTSTLADADFYESERSASTATFRPLRNWSRTRFGKSTNRRASPVNCWSELSRPSRPTRKFGWR